jgi:hypothetical protein
MEAADIVQATMKVLKDSDVSEAAMPVAFAKVFDFIASGGVASPPAGAGAGPTTAPGSGSQSSASSTASSGGSPLVRVAARLGVDAGEIEKVFDFHEGELHLVVHPSRLNAAKASSTVQIALLMSAGRQALDLDEAGTSIETVRVIAEHFKRYDHKNFSTTIGTLSKVMTVRGTGKNRTLKMTSPAWAEASTLAKSLIEG